MIARPHRVSVGGAATAPHEGLSMLPLDHNVGSGAARTSSMATTGTRVQFRLPPRLRSGHRHRDDLNGIVGVAKTVPLWLAGLRAPRLVEGATIQGWKAALGALSLAYPDRLDRYL